MSGSPPDSSWSLPRVVYSKRLMTPVHQAVVYVILHRIITCDPNTSYLYNLVLNTDSQCSRNAIDYVRIIGNELSARTMVVELSFEERVHRIVSSKRVTGPFDKVIHFVLLVLVVMLYLFTVILNLCNTSTDYALLCF